MKQNGIEVFIIQIFLFISTSCLAQNIKPVTVSDIYKDYRFVPEYLDEFSSMKDGLHYTVLEDNRIIARFDYATGRNRTVLFNTGDHAEIGSFSDYAFSTDEKKILLATESTPIYRYSFAANYMIYDIAEKTITPLDREEKQRLATFSPDGTKIAYTKNNNLFVKDLSSGKLSQITFDGQINHIINGAPDWVYEEEFGFTQGYCWSPDSRFLAYYKFDETRVKQYDLTLYNSLYPETRSYKYPKAGEENSKASVYVYNLENGSTVQMHTGSDTEAYIPRIKWTAAPERLCIIILNRLQNNVRVQLNDALSGEAETIYSEVNAHYISRVDDNFIRFTADGNFFIVLSERSGYFHYYRYTIKGELVNSITQGPWEVQELLDMDDKNNILYYRSNEMAVICSDVFSIRLDGSGKLKLSQKEGTNTATFSSTFAYFINTWSNANTPEEFTLHSINGNQLRVLKGNEALRKEVMDYGFSKKEFITIPVDNNMLLNAYMIKPPDFDSTKKYPLFIDVYGGPESQDVLDSWDNQLPWHELLAQKGIIVVGVDNRGTDGRGEAFRKCTYLQLGKLETEDQLNAAVYLSNKSWINKDRIGIWGWSYGGYMTLLCMTKGAGIFKLGIAVAPVTNWRFYDSVYTERFMRTPQENKNGYDNNSPLNFAGLLTGKLLLVHGTADDNVHLQNTVEMADMLIRENKQFSMFLYPDKNHSITGANTRYHLFSMITDYILQNL